MKSKRRLIRTLVIMFSVTVVLTACSSIPYTGQLILGSSQSKDRSLNADAATTYSEFLTASKDYIVRGTAEAQMVQRVGDKIRDAAEKWAEVNGKSEYLQGFQWEYTLIRSNEENAFCMPGGKIVVYTGILPITKNEDGLAAILGHEVAHALLKHTQQKK